MHAGESLLPKHGGYKNTRTWRLADLSYDVTVRFCDKYVDPRSRTHDQMVQAARSGCQNLQEGSVDSATSKKIEIKLTGIAKGALSLLNLCIHLIGRQIWKPRLLPLKKKGGFTERMNRVRRANRNY